MAKKQQKMTRIELLDNFAPIFAACWVLALGYIALFNESGLFALITVVPMFFLYGLYVIGSAIYCYKEPELLKLLGKDSRKAELKRHKKTPKLSIAKLTTGGICIILGILLCIIL